MILLLAFLLQWPISSIDSVEVETLSQSISPTEHASCNVPQITTT